MPVTVATTSVSAATKPSLPSHSSKAHLWHRLSRNGELSLQSHEQGCHQIPRAPWEAKLTLHWR
eukprot:5101355-Ditylum_brightwellii.AAC.1